MPPHPHRPAELAWQVFRGSDVVRRGLLTRHQFRGASWLRLRHDVYADARLDRDRALACRAALLRLPPGTLIAGPSAAYLHGVEHAAGFADDVHVLLPPTARADAQPGIRVHRIRTDVSPTCAGLLDAGSSATNSVVRTSNGRTAGGTDRPADDAGPFRPVPASALATAARSVRRAAPPAVRQPSRVGGDHIRPGPLSWLPRRAPAACAPGRRRYGPTRYGRSASSTRCWPGVWSAGARSPTWRTATVDGPVAGARAGCSAWPIRRRSPRRSRTYGSASCWPACRDRSRNTRSGSPPGWSCILTWPPQFRVAVEYDGTWHADADQLHRDRQRLNQFVGAGWTVLHVTSRRLHRDFAAVVREVRAALVAQGWRA